MAFHHPPQQQQQQQLDGALGRYRDATPIATSGPQASAQSIQHLDPDGSQTLAPA